MPGISEQEWRADVSRRVDKNEETQQSAAVILERLTNRLDEHDKRIKALEDAPKEQGKQGAAKEGLRQQTIIIVIMIVSIVLGNLGPHMSISFH